MYCIFSFESRSEVMNLFSVAQSKKISAQIINTPSFVGRGCSLSVRFDYKNFDLVSQLIERIRPRTFVGAYLLLDHSPFFRQLI